jgi:hypothetical protein
MVKSEDIYSSGGRENSFQGVDGIYSSTPIYSFGKENHDFAYPSYTRKESDSSRLGVEGLSNTPIVVLDGLPNNITLLSSDKADAYYESARSLHSQSSVISGDSITSPNETTPLDPSSETTNTRSAKLMGKLFQNILLCKVLTSYQRNLISTMMVVHGVLALSVLMRNGLDDIVKNMV